MTIYYCESDLISIYAESLNFPLESRLEKDKLFHKILYRSFSLSILTIVHQCRQKPVGKIKHVSKPFREDKNTFSTKKKPPFSSVAIMIQAQSLASLEAVILMCGGVNSVVIVRNQPPRTTGLRDFEKKNISIDLFLLYPQDTKTNYLYCYTRERMLPPTGRKNGA